MPFRKIALTLVVAALTLLGAELAFRALLSSDLEIAAPLRDPELYADSYSEDLYWKLYYRWDGRHRPPERPHPVLGWVGDFDRESYRHDDAGSLEGRRPVLLYGDSFARCVQREPCFQDILNADPAFARDRYLLNYGVGGYGLDQIFLLLRNSVGLYEDPFVVVSLLTFDLDRAALSVRTGQKPRFRTAGEGLELEPTPIYPQAEDFFAEHPPAVGSYLWRKLIHSDLLPPSLSWRLRGEAAHRRLKTELGRRLFAAIGDELGRRGLEFVFVVFHTQYPDPGEPPEPPGWRNRLLRSLVEESGVPYVWSAEVLAEDIRAHGLDREAYIDPGHRHPTARYNRLIAAEIERLSRRAPRRAPRAAAAPYPPSRGWPPGKRGWGGGSGRSRPRDRPGPPAPGPLRRRRCR